MQGGITAGTVMAVLLPILIAMLCYASYVRNKNQDDYQDPQFVRSGSRRLRRAFSRSRRDPSPEARPVKHYGGSSTVDDRNSDDTQV
ncbi:hypothetical protein Pcinc_038001 [Petrolisthes cinctipes]|uniref:Uncharacterized protein n=1 Tax=Petrolisthes cinctipes TaxID=88211 RepID=A0AAE1BRE0_PETCI|nr:hypothetical protein Pcinc_038001 [Petrolisthes cinctipes]